MRDGNAHRECTMEMHGECTGYARGPRVGADAEMIVKCSWYARGELAGKMHGKISGYREGSLKNTFWLNVAPL